MGFGLTSGQEELRGTARRPADERRCAARRTRFGRGELTWETFSRAATTVEPEMRHLHGWDQVASVAPRAGIDEEGQVIRCR